MKRGRILFGFSIVLLILSLFPTNRLLPKWFQSTGYYDLGPGQVNGPTLELVLGSSVELDVVITGANKDVYFYITDSNGKKILDAGRIYDGYHLEWTSPAIGSFRLNFDNTMSWFSHKEVGWSCKVFHYRTLFLLSGIGLLIIGVLQIFREEKVVQKLRNRMFKKPEPLEVECEYCGAFYSKTLYKCPHCGAQRKVGAPRKRKTS